LPTVARFGTAGVGFISPALVSSSFARLVRQLNWIGLVAFKSLFYFIFILSQKILSPFYIWRLCLGLAKGK
jgi:hypothetical protein